MNVSLPPGNDGLLELCRRLLAARRTGTALDILVQGTIELLDAESGYLVRELGGQLLFFKRWGSRPDGNLRAVSSSIVRSAMDSGEPLLVPDVAASEFAMSESVLAQSLKSVLASRVDAGEPVALYIESGSRSMGARELDLFRKIIELADDLLVENAERLLRDSAPALSERHDLAGFIAHDPKTHQVLQTAVKVAKMRHPVLLLGPSGAGKERLAAVVHRNSRRGDRPLQVINCASLQESLAEATLFGQEAGAFTGAKAKRGALRHADGATLLLDEIGDLSPEVQAKLLRTLENGEVHPLGAAAPSTVDVRFLAATNKDLTAAVRDRTFREDLYYRLASFTLTLPPLAERPQDVLPLMEHFLREEAHAEQVAPPRLDGSARAALLAAPWPGNVRQLQNLARQLVALHAGEDVDVADLELGAESSELPPLRDEEHERGVIVRHLEACDWNKSRAARSLGISREGLRQRMKRLGVESAD